MRVTSCLGWIRIEAWSLEANKKEHGCPLAGDPDWKSIDRGFCQSRSRNGEVWISPSDRKNKICCDLVLWFAIPTVAFHEQDMRIGPEITPNGSSACTRKADAREANYTTTKKESIQIRQHHRTD
jgi:hypothetical protein